MLRGRGSTIRRVCTALVTSFLAIVALNVAIEVVSSQSLSPALNPAKIEIDEPVGQGEEARLPLLGVFNRGDLPSLFEMDTLFTSSQEERAPGHSWFRFEPQTFRLEAGEGRTVEVLLKVPKDAELGAYRMLLRVRAKPSEDSSTAGTSLRAAVATTLLFSVKNVDFHFYDPVIDFFVGRAPFSYIGTGLLLALSAVYLFQRQYGLDIDFGFRVTRKD